jgi:uncharacterized protein (TIGR02147 family)
MAAPVTASKVDIFGYTNPMDYLKAVYQAQKVQDAQITWQAFAKRLDISPSLLKMLLNGTRNFTLEHIHRIASCLKLSHKEHEFLEIMTLLHQAETPVEKAYYQTRKSSIKSHPQDQGILLNPRLIRIEWFVPGLIVYLLQVCRSRELEIDDIDIQEASQYLGIAEDIVRETVERLKQMGVLAVNDRRLAIVIDNLSGSVSVKKLVRQITEESLERLKSSFHEPNTFFHSVACTFYPSDLPKIRLGLKELIEKYSQDPKAELSQQKVYQCLFHIWPFA